LVIYHCPNREQVPDHRLMVPVVRFHKGVRFGQLNSDVAQLIHEVSRSSDGLFERSLLRFADVMSDLSSSDNLELRQVGLTVSSAPESLQVPLGLTGRAEDLRRPHIAVGVHDAEASVARCPRPLSFRHRRSPCLNDR
jgi:hypothetical protein